MSRKMVAPRVVRRPGTRYMLQLKYNTTHDAHGRFGSGHKVGTNAPTGSGRQSVESDEDAKATKHFAGHTDAPAAKAAIVRDVSARIMTDPKMASAVLGEAVLSKEEYGKTKYGKTLDAKEIEEAYHVYTQARQSSVAVKVNERLSGWSATSGDDQPKALSMQRAISEEFEHPESWKEMTTRMSPELIAKVNAVHASEGERNRAIARAIYDNTQERLAKEGVDEVLLHRGMGFASAATAPKWTNYGYRDNVHLQPINSFSSEGATAASFGVSVGEVSRIISTKVPRERIFSTALTGFGSLAEREFVVLGTGKTPAKITNIEEDAGGGQAKPAPKVAPKPAPKPKPQAGTHEPKVTASPPKVSVPAAGKTTPPANDFKTPFQSLKSAVKVRSTDLPDLKVKAAEDAVTAVHSVLPNATLSRQERLGIYTLQPGATGNAPASMSIAGQYSGGVSGKAMTLNKKSYGRADDMQVTVHEMGHWVDNVMGQRQSGTLDTAYKRQMASDKLVPSNPQYNVFKAIQDTPEVKKWQTTAAGKGVNAEYHRYMMEPRELYARAFSQYIAYRSNHTDLVNGIKGRADSHWKLTNFEPVAKAFDEQFKQMGWSK